MANADVEAARTLAPLHLQAGYWALAMDAYARILEAEPQNADALYGIAVCRMQLGGEDNQAFNDFGAALALNPNHPFAGRAYNFRGDQFRAIGALELAVGEYTLAMTAGTTVQHVFSRGECLFDLGRYAEALKDFSRAIAEGHALEKAHLLRAYCLCQLGGRRQAIEDFTAHLALNPQDAEALSERGECFMVLDQLDRAEADFTEAVDLLWQAENANGGEHYVQLEGGVSLRVEVGEPFPTEQGEMVLSHPALCQTYTRRGQCRILQRKLHEALSDLEDAVRLDPQSGLAYSVRGLCRLERGEQEEALADFEAAVQMEPDNLSYIEWRAECLCDMRRWTESLRDLDTVIAEGGLQSLLFRAFQHRARVYGALERWQDAVDDWEELTTQFGMQPNALGHYQYGYCLFQSGRYKQAIQYIEQSLALSQEMPVAAECLSIRARYYMRRKLYRRALADLKEVVRRQKLTGNNEALALAYQCRGEALYLKGDFDRARVNLDRALALNPELADSHYWRARCHSDQKRWAAAMRDLDEAVRLGGDTAHAANYLTSRGYCLTFQERFDEALDSFDRAIELNPELPPAYHGRASAHLRSENWWAALQDCNTLLELSRMPLSPNRAEIYKMRSICHDGLAQHDEAKADRSRAKRLRKRQERRKEGGGGQAGGAQNN